MQKLFEQIENENADMECLLRIEAFVKAEGFTCGKIIDAINEYKEYVKNGGVL